MRELWNSSSCFNTTIHFYIPEAAHTAVWKFNEQEHYMTKFKEGDCI